MDENGYPISIMAWFGNSERLSRGKSVPSDDSDGVSLNKFLFLRSDLASFEYFIEYFVTSAEDLFSH